MKDSRVPPDPPGRVRTEGGESGDSEIEEVGRAYRHSSSREQGLASSSFDWGASSFTSTLSRKRREFKNPLLACNQETNLTLGEVHFKSI